MSSNQKAIKRAFDIFFSFFGLLALWPVIAVSVLIARLDTGMSGLFVQKRVGQHGRLLSIPKIRTMRRVAGVETSITVRGDSRVTPIGMKLRSLKLDELPQLWNVFIGDMSFVGPRPDVPGYADTLTGLDRELLELKPGITGPATIKYRNEEELLSFVKDAERHNNEVIYPDKVRINIDYLRSWSLLGDLKYILMTLRLVQVPDVLSPKIDELV